MFAKFWVLIEWKIQKGVFKIKLLLLELLNSPAFIGLMGFNSSEENVDRLLNLFDTELKKFSIFESSTF